VTRAVTKGTSSIIKQRKQEWKEGLRQMKQLRKKEEQGTASEDEVKAAYGKYTQMMNELEAITGKFLLYFIRLSH
jgi:hypothetical protein